MKLVGEFSFQAKPEEVWEGLLTPEVLAVAVPGTKKLEKTGENVYEGEMDVHVGPVGGLFNGRVELSDVVPPKGYTIQIDGKGGPGFAQGTGKVELVPQEDGTTIMRYDVDLKIGGRLASVGQRVIESVGKSMTRQSLEAINKAIQTRLASKSQGKDLQDVQYEAPSKAGFAAGVASDLLRGNMPLFLLILLSIVVILSAVYYFLS